MVKLLGDSAAVRRKLKKMFTKETRSRKRLVISAFVGREPLSILPDVKGVDVYVWPHPSATNPDGLAALKKAGAKVRLVDGLHAKVYAVEGIGAIVTSANLSKRAFSLDLQHEVGVFIDDDDVVLSALNDLAMRYRSDELTKKRLTELLKAYRPPEQWPKPNCKFRSFREWLRETKNGAYGQDRVRLGWWEHKEDDPGFVADFKSEFGSEPDDWAYFAEGQIEVGDWFLYFELRDDKACDVCLEYVHSVAPCDAKKYDWTHRAAWLNGNRPPAPFDLSREKTLLRNAMTFAIGAHPQEKDSAHKNATSLSGTLGRALLDDLRKR